MSKESSRVVKETKEMLEFRDVISRLSGQNKLLEGDYIAFRNVMIKYLADGDEALYKNLVKSLTEAP
jgi:chemotaxis methyl-accepting protein methylase